MFESFVKSYVKDLVDSLERLDINTLEKISLLISKAISNDKKIFMIGNGGSSATPSHSAGDFSKELKARTICLSDNVPSLTAWGNDTSYDNIFKGQLETFLDEGDLVIGYSGSGNSVNVLNAIEFANSKGAHTIAITGNYMGKGGGKIIEIAKINLIFETKSMERIEDLQLIINHMIKESIKGNIVKQDKT